MTEAAFGSEPCCLLRRTATHADGRPRFGVQADKQIAEREERKTVRFRISTQKVGDAVMISVEEAPELHDSLAAACPACPQLIQTGQPGYFIPCSPAKPQRVRRYVRPSQAPVDPG